MFVSPIFHRTLTMKASRSGCQEKKQQLEGQLKNYQNLTVTSLQQ
jgi:hypothetical protein